MLSIALSCRKVIRGRGVGAGVTSKCTLTFKEFFVKKILTLLVMATAAFLCAGSVLAQALPEVKTGDKLTWSYSQYQENIKEIVLLPTKEEVSVVTINPANGDREYLYTDGTKLVRNDQFGPKAARDERVFNEKKMFNVLQGAPVVGQKWSFEAEQKITSSLSPACNRMQFSLTATVLPGPAVTVRVRGVDTSVKTLLIKQEGNRYYTPCPSAVATFSYLYSPELKEVVETEYVSYYRGLIYVGSSKTTLRSID